jgi:ABC-2 type transport system permease protein
MRAIWTIAKREIVSFFVSPLAYVVLTTWLVFQGGTFWVMSFWFSQQDLGSSSSGANPLSHFFGGTTLFYIPIMVYTPLLTMRLLAEEHRQGTIEPLLTAPVSDTAVVLGKYFASLVFWIALWVPTLMYVWLTSRFGDIDPWQIASTYLGVFGLGAYYMALGLLMSALTRNQITAAVLTFVTIGAIFMMGLLSFLVTDDAWRGVFEYMSLWSHMSTFGSGIVDSRYVTYELSLAALGVFLSIRALEARRYEA